MTIAADPFAQVNATTGTMTFDDPTEPATDYVRIEDIDSRTVAIFPKESRREKNSKNEEYTKVIADVVVLDGPVFGKVTEVPMLVADMHLSAENVVKAIVGNVGTGRGIMGRIDSKRSQHGGKVYALKAVDAGTKLQYGPVVQSVLAARLSDPA